MYEIRKNVRRKIEFIVMVPNREMQSLSVMTVMLYIEVGEDCSIIHRLYMKDSVTGVTCVNIKLPGRIISPLT